MNTDDFEKRLQRQTLRQIPDEWREEILAATRDDRTAHHSSPPVRHFLATLLWPHPKAWAALATAWVFIVAANVFVRDTTPRIAGNFTPSPETILVLRQQERLFAELIGTGEMPDALPAKPQPHSERRQETMQA